MRRCRDQLSREVRYWRSIPIQNCTAVCFFDFWVNFRSLRRDFRKSGWLFIISKIYACVGKRSNSILNGVLAFSQLVEFIYILNDVFTSLT